MKQSEIFLKYALYLSLVFSRSDDFQLSSNVVDTVKSRLHVVHLYVLFGYTFFLFFFPGGRYTVLDIHLYFFIHL